MLASIFDLPSPSALPLNIPEQSTDEFLASVAHELRTPLTSLLGAVGLMAGGAAGSLPQGAQALAELAQRNGERLSRLIDDLLDLSRLEGDRMRLTLSAQELGSLIHEAVAQHQVIAGRHGVALRTVEDQRAEIERWVAVDPDRFQQVMANLLVNAIRHSAPGDSVQVALQERGDRVQISVRDQGPGIDPAIHPRLFERFVHASSGRSNSSGSNGLGLYLSRLLIERMGGRITAESPIEHFAGTGPGRGTIFHLDLPRVEATDPDA
ncbi:MAG: sensor histidine kinase [Betaproteobacteria bacterium]|nr:sensor histidine kinase [Betaproteobacteria bacterium]